GVAGIWRTHHGMSADGFRQMSEDLRYQGYRPVIVSGQARAGATEFAALWRNYSMSKEDLSTIDWIVSDTMAKAGAPGLSLAITQGGRLVFAKAYGVSDPAAETPLTTSNRFRIAGVT